MTSPTTSHRRPEGRYDEPRRFGGKLAAVVLGVLFLGLLASIGYALYSRLGVDRATVRVIGFDVVSEELVRIDVEVVKPAGSAAYCLLRARGESGGEVGREVVQVAQEGDERRVVRLEHDLATDGLAVTGESTSCALEDPGPVPPAP